MAREESVEHPRWNDARMTQLVSGVLRGGVLLAAAVAALGALGLLVQHGSQPADYHLFMGQRAEYRSIGAVLGGARQLQSRAIIQLGIVLLIATPVIRVLLSLLTFVLQRDRLYAAITALVLAVLLYGLVLGGRV